MLSVHGTWKVDVEGIHHSVQADLSVYNYLRVYIDGSTLHESYVFFAQGEVYSFYVWRHTFELQVEGYVTREFSLLMDGQVIGQTETPRIGPEPVGPATLDVISEQNVTESSEFLDTEAIPLDNSAGSAPLVTEREVTMTATNELSLQTDLEGDASLNLQLFTVIEADLSGKLARHTGQKIGQTITERTKLTFTVQPKSSVTYTVVWRRKHRSGQYNVSTSEGTKVVPYNMYYGLWPEVKSGDFLEA